MKLCSVLALLVSKDTQKWSHGNSLGIVHNSRQLLALCGLVPTQFLCFNFHSLSFLTELSPRRMIYVY